MKHKDTGRNKFNMLNTLLSILHYNTIYSVDMSYIWNSHNKVDWMDGRVADTVLLVLKCNELRLNGIITGWDTCITNTCTVNV